MAKQVILAVAGAGKTYYICHCINKNKKNLILAYTHRNVNNIKKELIDSFGEIPELTTIMTFDSFVYRYLICPYEPTLLKSFNREDFKRKGITLKQPPKQIIKRNGKQFPNQNYYKKNVLEHYMYNSQYYCSKLSELLSTADKSTKILKRISTNLNRFFDCMMIDEFQDFREFDYEIIVKLSHNIDNVLLVGDYYQHSVSAINNAGKPFVNRGQSIGYDEYIKLLEREKLVVDNTSLLSSRRCPDVICNFVKTKLNININADNYNSGKVVLVEEDIIEVLNNDNIVKLVYSNSSKYTFNSINWSYSKGDTINSVCVILTNEFEKILDDDFDCSKISAITINKLYVAMTRTRGDLYLIKQSDFKKVKDLYLSS